MHMYIYGNPLCIKCRTTARVPNDSMRWGIKQRAWVGLRVRHISWMPTFGQSGSSSDNREDFKKLMTNVMMNYAGAIFAIEASRLSRLGSDWHRLLEACAITDTLIIDEDGCYNPTDFNDRMLLGLKGTMSNAELHYIRARMEGGRLHKSPKRRAPKFLFRRDTFIAEKAV